MEKKISGDKVKWGIIGVGDVCEVKSAPAMQKVKGSELVAVMRRNGEKAKDYAERHGVGKWYDNADALIQDPEVNAIYIATPPKAHSSLTLKAAKAGKPVYVEKPMARTTAECQEMINACHQAKVPLYIAYYRRRLPNFEKLKPMPVNWRIDPEVAGGGYFFDLAAHQLDYLDYALGPIQFVSGYAANQAGLYKAADIITSSFVFENGILGTGSWCFTVDKIAEKDQMTIVGSKGQLRIPFFGAPKIFVEKSNLATEVLEFELPHHIQQPLIETVVKDLLGKGTCPSTGESAIRTNWVMEEMTKNYYQS
jgi:predicted dehydrogenase